MNDDLLVLQGVSGGYGRIPILFDIDLALAAGDFVGLLGNNGMGKSTLLRAIAGHLSTVSGSFRYRGQSMNRWRSDERARSGIGYVPQGRQIFSDLTVLENLRMGAIGKNRAEGDAIVEKVLVDLPRLKLILDRRGGVLSGGEQQILALGRAMCGTPKLLLLDEPTEGIQPSIVGEIRSLLKALSRTGEITIVLVEQNLTFLMDVAERIHVIRKGQLSGPVPSDKLTSGYALDADADLAVA